MAIFVAVGDDGRIFGLGSGLGGPHTAPTQKHLNGVSSARRPRSSGEPLIVAVGDDGVILRYRGERAWEHCPSPTDQDLHAISFAPGTRTAWAVGNRGTVLKTVDGGSSWGLQSAQLGFDAHAVFTIDERRMWIVGEEGSMQKTDDGGATWRVARYGSRDAKHLRGVTRTAAGVAAVGDDGTLVYAHDGAWSVATFGDTRRRNLRAIAAAPGGVIVMVGDDGVIGQRRPQPFDGDETRHWEWQTRITSKHLRGVAAFDDQHWAIAGDDGELLHSDDAGASWKRTFTGGKHLRAVG